MKNLFIDTNVWLSLYHFTNDDLAQFNKLKDLIGKEIKLYIPEQVKDEIERNREAKLQDAFSRFEVKSIQYPAFCKGYEEYDSFYRDYEYLISRYKKWKDKIDDDIRNEKLPADLAINELHNLVEIIPCDNYVEAAYARYRKGNPPGKDNKYGDAINWECLLDNVPDGEDLYLISMDKDYKAILSPNNFNPFLKHEWRERKKSDILFYDKLTTFLNEHVKSIQLKTEEEKDSLIEKLSESANFMTTHGIISMLRNYNGWSETQVERLCQIAEENSQVSWILFDEDVLSFYFSLFPDIHFTESKESARDRIMTTLFENIPFSQ